MLGFRNLAGREDAQWLSVALAEMLTTELAAGETMRTIPGENVTRMKIELALADADSYAPDTLARIRQNLGSRSSSCSGRMWPWARGTHAIAARRHPAAGFVGTARRCRS